jgi:hypothetical protein
MTKASGASLKPVRVAPRAAPASRPIKTFSRPADGPHRNPVEHPPIRGSNKIAANAVGVASNHDSAIDPRQMRK